MAARQVPLVPAVRTPTGAPLSPQMGASAFTDTKQLTHRVAAQDCNSAVRDGRYVNQCGRRPGFEVQMLGT